MPAVSVILNSFNQGRYLREAAESVLAQTFQDWELLIVDNGSTDDSAAIAKELARDPRVKLALHEHNEPITRRFNQAIAGAKGEYVCFLYSDDYFLPHKLESQVAAFRALPAEYGVVYGPATGLNHQTGTTWQYGSLRASGLILRDMFLNYERGQIDMSSPMVRRECLVRYPFYEDIFAEGEGIFFRIAMRYRFQHIADGGCVLRDHGANAGKAIRRNAEMTFETLERLERHPEFPRDLSPELHKYRSTLLRNYGWQSLRVGGDVKWARECLLHSVRVERSQLAHPRLIAGLALSLMPKPLRKGVNHLANSLRSSRENVTLTEGFGGSDHAK